MSAAPRYPSEMGYGGLRMSADEYLALGETQERYQLIDGVVVPMSPAPLADHNEILLEIGYQLKAFVRAGGAARVFVEADIKFGPALVYRPDLSVFRAGRLPAVVQRIDLAPDLIIEVLSDGTRGADQLSKRDDYERHGVAEYWVADPRDGRVRGWRREGLRFVDVGGISDSLPSSAIPGFVLDLRPSGRFWAEARGNHSRACGRQ